LNRLIDLEIKPDFNIPNAEVYVQQLLPRLEMTRKVAAENIKLEIDQ